MTKIRLMLGDCLEKMKEIEDGSVDAIICDPPYGTTACKWDAVIPFDLMWEQVWRVLKPKGACVLFGSQPFTTTLIASQINKFRYSWVWEKSKGSNFVLVKYQPLKTHEDIIVFGEYPAVPTKNGNNIVYNPQFQEGVAYNKGMRKEGNEVLGSRLESRVVASDGRRYPRSVQYFRTAESEGKFHPTQKPVALMEYLIRTYTNEGETVLDFTMGSGTTIVAAANTGRNSIGIERDEAYFKIASDRIEEAMKPKEDLSAFIL